MDFSDNTHNMAELVFQGAAEMDIAKTCREEVLQSLAIWRQRPDHQLSGAKFLQVENCSLFSITYDGEAGEYWPDEPMNDVSEILIREFLYRDGICNLIDEHVRLFEIKYNIMALDVDEHFLVCPYVTASGNISGAVVVCVTKMMRRPT
jgi:hypothetical protein